MTKIALATCSELPHGDEDDRELPALLDAEFVVWDDAGVDWSAYDLVVVRSTWDYQRRRDEFLEWAHAVPRVVNPPGVLGWNTDKRYLRDLAGEIPVVDTTFLEPGEALGRLDREVVVKPTISAGSRDTARFAPDEQERAEDLVQTIHDSGRTAMVQPYLASVDERGETALLFFGGAYSHAVRKGPILTPGTDPTGELFAAEDISPRTPTPAELDLAYLVVEHIGELPYTRVDVVEGPDRRPQLLELELTEPSLFFAHAEGSAQRFADAIRAAAG